MNNSVEIIIERQMIIDTITQMVKTADRKEWEKCLETFTTEVLLDHDHETGPGQPVKVKSSDMIANWEKIFAGFDSTWHSVSNYQIEIDGSHAVCESYVHAIHCNFKVTKGANYYTEYGLYRHELEKTANGWKIAAIQYRMINSEGNSSLFTY